MPQADPQTQKSSCYEFCALSKSQAHTTPKQAQNTPFATRFLFLHHTLKMRRTIVFITLLVIFGLLAQSATSRGVPNHRISIQDSSSSFPSSPRTVSGIISNSSTHQGSAGQNLSVGSDSNSLSSNSSAVQKKAVVSMAPFMAFWLLTNPSASHGSDYEGGSAEVKASVGMVIGAAAIAAGVAMT